ncbi:hypothetical protein JHK85_027635 [Glycine max]|nr:hypothetical protein JHK85_027635 [Glycine max]
MPPAPFSDEVSPSPLFPWHYNNPLHAASPGPSPSTSVTAPMVPYKSSCMPFISSNPAVPLPTDEKRTTGRENTTYLDNADEMRKTKGTEEEGTTMRAKSMGMKKNDIVA